MLKFKLKFVVLLVVLDFRGDFVVLRWYLKFRGLLRICYANFRTQTLVNAIAQSIQWIAQQNDGEAKDKFKAKLKQNFAKF